MQKYAERTFLIMPCKAEEVNMESLYWNDSWQIKADLSCVYNQREIKKVFFQNNFQMDD